MLESILVSHVSALCSSVYLNTHILMEVALLKGLMRVHAVAGNKTPPRMTRAGRETLYCCVCLLQSRTCERDKR